MVRTMRRGRWPGRLVAAMALSGCFAICGFTEQVRRFDAASELRQLTERRFAANAANDRRSPMNSSRVRRTIAVPSPQSTISALSSTVTPPLRAISRSSRPLSATRSSKSAPAASTPNESGHLMAEMTGQAKTELFPESATTFFDRSDSPMARTIFERDAAGNVVAQIYRSHGQKLRAAKIK